MAKVAFSSRLREEYEQLFNTCSIRPEKQAAVEQVVAELLENRPRYQSVGTETGIPWYFIAAVHSLEANRDFTRHLHNGDPLTARTVHVPAGRPRRGDPPFSWEQSATDALALRGIGANSDWSLAGTLYQLEGYNGWGYRLYHRHVLTPYLWSYCNHYRSGKYVADGTWSDSAVSRQCGAAVILRRMVEHGAIGFPDQPLSDPETPPLVSVYARRKPASQAVREKSETLQRWLNTFPGIFVKVDGFAGERTSNAYRRVTGHYLPGDPRMG